MGNSVISRSTALMGNRFDITVAAADETTALRHIDTAIAEISRIEDLLSTYRTDSETARINQMAGVSPVAVSPEVYQLIERSLKISALTHGAFDITYGSADTRLWNFDVSMSELPTRVEAQNTVKLINYRNIELNAAAQTVFLRMKGMHIGFGGIGKGYAADSAKRLLRQNGVEAGIINASGDMCTWGTPPNAHNWQVGLSDPENPSRAIVNFPLRNGAVATSGDYEKFITVNGKRYSHTIDPRTGLPVEGIKSVTVFAPTAELADAFTTPLMVMGIGPGLALINQMNNMECIFIDRHNRMVTSNGLKHGATHANTTKIQPST